MTTYINNRDENGGSIVVALGLVIIYWGRGGTKMRKSLAKKLWPTPINGIKKIDPQKAQIKNCDPPLR